MRPIALIFLALLPCQAADESERSRPPVTSPDKTMTVIQQGPSSAEDESIGKAYLKFKDEKHPAVSLDESGMPWTGLYSFSPDEHWLLRSQKNGSGSSEGRLYQLLSDGTVMQILGFDEGLWRASDGVARLKRKQLYHAHMSGHSWSKGHKLLIIEIGGSNTEKRGDAIEVTVTYDLEAHTFKAAEKPRPH